MFVHTHVHSEFSPLDGMCKIKELVEQAVRFGNPGLALTDHASTSGLYELQKECEKAKIKPILGSEFYISQQCEKNRGHLVLLAKNNNGLKNIYLLQEYSYRESFNRKPLINVDILKQYSTDLICTSACMANAIPQFILEGKYKEAKDMALLFKSIFGDDFYLEIQSNTIPEQKIINEEIVNISKETDIKLILTNDIHYVYKEDADIHEVMLALQQNKKMNDEKRWSFSTKDYYYKTEEEMKEDVKYLPIDVIESALNNTLEIMDKCNARIKKGNYLPSFPLENKTEEEYLRELTTQKYKERIKQGIKHTKERVERVERELKTIEEMGYSGYFLIVQDYVNWAKENNIYVGDGRGSGAGSEVAYIIGITEVDPLQYDLLFERFLTPGRVPDLKKSSIVETLCVKFGELRLQVGVYQKIC